MASPRNLRELINEVDEYAVVRERTEEAALVVVELNRIQELLSNYGVNADIFQGTELRDLKAKYGISDPKLRKVFSHWSNDGSAGQRLVEEARKGGIEIDTSTSWKQVPEAVDRARQQVRDHSAELKRQVLERVESLTPDVSWGVSPVAATDLWLGEVEAAFAWLISGEGRETLMGAYAAERGGGRGEPEMGPGRAPAFRSVETQERAMLGAIDFG